MLGAQVGALNRKVFKRKAFVLTTVTKLRKTNNYAFDKYITTVYK